MTGVLEHVRSDVLGIFVPAKHSRNSLLKVLLAAKKWQHLFGKTARLSRNLQVAASWTGFGITARPDTGVDGKPVGLRFQWVRSDQPFEPRQIRSSGRSGQRRDCPNHAGSAVPSSGALAFPGPVRSARRRAPRIGHRVDTQITCTLDSGRLKCFHFWRVHIQKDARSSSFCLLPLGRLPAVG